MCYNIRYFALHGRDLEDPWSCRNFCVYQQCHVCDCHSIWLLIQTPKAQQDLLEHDLVTASADGGPLHPMAHPLELHTRMLKLFQQSWTDYLEYLDDQIQQLVSKWMYNPGVFSSSFTWGLLNFRIDWESLFASRIQSIPHWPHFGPWLTTSTKEVEESDDYPRSEYRRFGVHIWLLCHPSRIRWHLEAFLRTSRDGPKAT